MARLALIFSVVLVVVLSSVLVESAPQGMFNFFNMLGGGGGGGRAPAPRLNGISGRAPAPRRGRPNNRIRGRTAGGSRSRASDNGKGKYWNNYDKDGYSRNGRDVSHVLAAHTAQRAQLDVQRR